MTNKKRLVIFVCIASVSALVQVFTAYLVQYYHWYLAFLLTAIPITISAILYEAVPPSKKLVHGLLELLHGRLIHVSNGTLKINDLRCSLLIPNKPRGKNRKLWVGYRYPVATSPTTFDICDERPGNGLAGRAFRLKEFKQEPIIDEKVSIRYWVDKWGLSEEQALELSRSNMQSIYCWPIFASDGSSAAVLAVDSKQPRTLKARHINEIQDVFIPLIQEALHTATQAGTKDTIQEALRRLGGK